MFPTCSGGLVPLWIVLSSDEPGLLAVLEAPDSLSPGDAMAGGHLVQPGHSATIEHVNVFSVLLLVGVEVGFKLQVRCVSPSFGATGARLVAAPTAGGENGREDLARTKSLSCNFSFLQGCL